MRRLPALAAAVALALALAACGGGPRPDPLAELDADTAGLGGGRPSVQLYAVLTPDPKAMQGADAVPGMWGAVGGQGTRYQAIRRHVKWVPGDYELDVALDFADLPHPQVPLAQFQAMAKALPAEARAALDGAKLAVFFRSDVPTLPGDAHVRLAGLAALYAADRWGGLVFDLVARKAWTADAWQRELAAPALTAGAHGLVGVRADGEGRWIYTHGEAKFGRPDLQVRRVPEAQLAAARAAVQAALKASRVRPLAAGGSLPTPAGEVTLGPCEAPPRFHDADCLQLTLP
ncbi:MAG: hypothetical protein H6702_14750 [Myxococcales bacterium]|nr:hypothetical protein [Myxococcales bacterium]